MYTEITTILDGIFDKKKRKAAFLAVALVSGTIVALNYMTPEKREIFIENNNIFINGASNGMLFGKNAGNTYILLPENYFMLPNKHTCGSNVLAEDFRTWCTPYNEPVPY
jgi:hypothetical protein